MAKPKPKSKKSQAKSSPPVRKKKDITSRPHRLASLGKRPPVEGQELMLPPRKAGRPEVYTEALAAEILERIASGESVISICSNEGMPSSRTVINWALFRPEFKKLYDMAKEIQSHVFAARIQDVAENQMIGEKVTEYLDKDGEVSSTQVTRHDMLDHRKNLGENYKWLASRMNPKAYGDKVQTENTNTHNINIKKITRVFVNMPKTIDHER